MRKYFFLALVFVIFSSVQSQTLRFGIKAGANFSDLVGDGTNDFDISTKTGFHIGALVEFKLLENLSIQPEVMYSAKGAKLDDFNDVNFNYITVPVLAKLYLVTEKLSLEVGPQFSFLIDESVPDQFESESFDFGAVGGLGYQLTENIFIQLRYVAGLTDTSKDAEIRNQVFQLSLGYRF